MLKKVSIAIMIIIIVLNCVTINYATIETMIEYNSANISKGHISTYYSKSNAWGIPTAYYMYYTENGTRYPAYCINEGLDGVTEAGNYIVDSSQLISDQRIWRVLYKGYGFNTPAEMGLECKEDAYLVTRFAVYSILSNYDVDLKYRANDETGEKMIQVLKELVEFRKIWNTDIPSPIFNY